MSQWPKWLRRQYGKLEICGSSPGYDTNFSLSKKKKLPNEKVLVLTEARIRIAPPLCMWYFALSELNLNWREKQGLRLMKQIYFDTNGGRSRSNVVFGSLNNN